MCNTVRSAAKSDASGKLQILPNYVHDKKRPNELYCRSSLQPTAPVLSDDIVFPNSKMLPDNNTTCQEQPRDVTMPRVRTCLQNTPLTKFECESEVTALS